MCDRYSCLSHGQAGMPVLLTARDVHDTVRIGAKRCDGFNKTRSFANFTKHCGSSLLGIILAPRETGASLLSLPCALQMHEEDWKLGCSTLGKNCWLWRSDVSSRQAYLRKDAGMTNVRLKMTIALSSNRKTRSGRRTTTIGEMTSPRTTRGENPDGAAQ